MDLLNVKKNIYTLHFLLTPISLKQGYFTKVPQFCTKIGPAE